MADAVNPTPLTRDDLYKAFPNQPKVVRAFEQLFRLNASTADTITAGTAATEALQDATVVTLSANDAFTNERVLAVDTTALTLQDQGPGQQIIIGMVNLIRKTQNATLFLNLDEDTALDLPPSGRVVTLSQDGASYADDTAAAAAGIAVGDVYRKTGGTLAWRQV